jgi:hypothetical protein
MWFHSGGGRAHPETKLTGRMAGFTTWELALRWYAIGLWWSRSGKEGSWLKGNCVYSQRGWWCLNLSHHHIHDDMNKQGKINFLIREENKGPLSTPQIYAHAEWELFTFFTFWKTEKLSLYHEDGGQTLGWQWRVRTQSWRVFVECSGSGISRGHIYLWVWLRLPWRLLGLVREGHGHVIFATRTGEGRNVMGCKFQLFILYLIPQSLCGGGKFRLHVFTSRCILLIFCFVPKYYTTKLLMIGVYYYYCFIKSCKWEKVKYTDAKNENQKDKAIYRNIKA